MPSSVSATIPTSRSRVQVGPSRLFQIVSIAEAITWTLLLIGMFLKYVTHTTDVGVRIFGTLHGAVFIAYGVTTVLVWIDQRWTWRRGLVALACAIPPFATLVFDRWVEKHDILGNAWRLRSTEPRGLIETAAAWAVRHPFAGGLVALVLVAALFSVALLLGPPVSV
ncbi:DUF3817 domain-containing protein [Tessaracoccus sp.]